eukprot:9361735-Prorocentrum_lima.AAC.1
MDFDMHIEGHVGQPWDHMVDALAKFVAKEKNLSPGFPEEAWRDFLANRKTWRCPVKEQGLLSLRPLAYNVASL